MTASTMAMRRSLQYLLLVLGIVVVSLGANIRFPRKNILSLETLKNVSVYVFIILRRCCRVPSVMSKSDQTLHNTWLQARNVMVSPVIMLCLLLK